jgi:hypothetical protein
MKTYKVDVDDDGNKYWLLNNKLHREDGPAIEYADGSKQWFLNGKRHRTDGPAVEDANGSKEWYLNGKCHRVDGPAVEYATDSKYWYLNGVQYTEADWIKQLQKAKSSCAGKIVEIDGVKYKLVEV